MIPGQIVKNEALLHAHGVIMKQERIQLAEQLDLLVKTANAMDSLPAYRKGFPSKISSHERQSLRQ